MVAPGTYTVTMSRRVRGEVTAMGEPRTFRVTPLHNTTLTAPDREALAAFQTRASDLIRSLNGTQRVLGEAQEQVALLKKALDDAPSADALALRARVVQAQDGLRAIAIRLNGDWEIRSREEAVEPSLADRVNRMSSAFFSTSAPTRTQQRAFEIVSGSLGGTITELRTLLDTLRDLGDRAEAAGATWTPGRMPVWNGK